MKVLQNVPLKNYTTFKTGGLADFFCPIENREGLLECFEWIKKKKLNYFVLGGGSNLVINDSGFRGVVIKILYDSISFENNVGRCAAGTTLASLVKTAESKGLGGLEWGFGIPASLGGAVRNNAGAFGSAISENISTIEYFDLEESAFKKISKGECGFSYHKSIFQSQKSWIIWQAEIALKEIPEKTIESNIQNFLKKRKNNQPLEHPSAGSYFKNPSLSTLGEKKREQLVRQFIKSELEKNKFSEANNKEGLASIIENKLKQNNSIPAGYLIERSGLKGKRIGGAAVSEKHANFIINTGSATSENIIILASIIKQKVRSRFEIQLYEEVEYVGY